MSFESVGHFIISQYIEHLSVADSVAFMLEWIIRVPVGTTCLEEISLMFPRTMMGVQMAHRMFFVCMFKMKIIKTITINLDVIFLK